MMFGDGEKSTLTILHVFLAVGWGGGEEAVLIPRIFPTLDMVYSNGIARPHSLVY